MIVWDDNIVYDVKSSKKSEKIRGKLDARKLSSIGTYCVAIAVNKDNLFDIYNMGELLFRYHRDSDEQIRIVGVASSKESAMEVAGAIIEMVFQKTGNTDIRSFYHIND